MADSEREMQTKPLTPTPIAPLATVHIVTYLRWEREGFETFEARRARLLDLIARLHEHMNAHTGQNVALRSFALGGQTVLLEDIATVRPDLVTLLVIYNAGGRLGIGPYYVLVDEVLVNGESLVRNLLAARQTAEQYGMRLSSVAYAPDASAHPAQLPQILRAFGVDAAFMRHSVGVSQLPFRWEAPDGNSILVVSDDTAQEVPTTTDAVRAHFLIQRRVRPDGPFLWLVNAESLNEVPLSEKLVDLTRLVGLPLQQSDFRDYVMTLRRELPDSARPAITGELRLQTLKPHAYLHPGTMSARLYLKQRHAEAESRLLYGVEPWLSVALTAEIPLADNVRALLRYAWRLLLRNQARHALGGTGSDPVHQDTEARYRQLDDVMQALTEKAFVALSSKPHQRGRFPDSTQTFVTVWNPHNWPVRQIVEIPLDLPQGKHPAALNAVESPNEEALYGWNAQGRTLIFLAECPAVGYNTYRVRFSDSPPDMERVGVKSMPGRVIGKTTGETLSVADGRLVWKRDAHRIEDLLTFIDSGDAGDAYNYSPPGQDVLVQADLVDHVEIESTPLYERLIITHRMRVTPQLREDRKRERGLKLITLRTTATLYEHTPGVYFRTTFENTAKDHRLRAHLRTGLQADRVTVDSPYALIERPVSQEGPAFPPADRPNLEGISNTHAMHSLASVRTGTQSLTLLSRGLPEYEAIRDTNGLTFALTLVRAIGQLSRGDLRTRTASVAPEIAIPDAQCLREITAEFALVNTVPGSRAELLRISKEYTAPLQAVQTDSAPADRARRSFLSVISDLAVGADSDGEGAILTSFKPPEKGSGWVLRFYNPHDKPVEIYLTPYQRPLKGYLLTLAEAIEGYIEPDANGRVALTVNPHEVVTVLLSFDA